MQAEGNDHDHDQGREHQVGLGSPVGQQHQVAQPLGGTDPFPDNRADGGIDRGQFQP